MGVEIQNLIYELAGNPTPLLYTPQSLVVDYLRKGGEDLVVSVGLWAENRKIQQNRSSCVERFISLSGYTFFCKERKAEQ